VFAHGNFSCFKGDGALLRKTPARKAKKMEDKFFYKITTLHSHNTTTQLAVLKSPQWE